MSRPVRRSAGQLVGRDADEDGGEEDEQRLDDEQARQQQAAEDHPDDDREEQGTAGAGVDPVVGLAQLRLELLEVGWHQTWAARLPCS